VVIKVATNAPTLRPHTMAHNVTSKNRGVSCINNLGCFTHFSLSEAIEPSVEDWHTAWLNGSENDSHPAVVSRIGDGALSDEICASVGNPQSDLCSGGERSKGLDKTSEQAQILGVRRKLLFRHKVRDLSPSNKVEARRSMLSRMNRRVTSACRILCQTRIPGQTESTAVSWPAPRNAGNPIPHWMPARTKRREAFRQRTFRSKLMFERAC